MSKKGILIIISGFSGAGKGTVVKELLSKHDYVLSISSTTRSPRSYEQEGREYFFVTKENFRDMIDHQKLIEWAQYCDNYYGTPKEYVEEHLEQGHDVILEIEMQGALAVKEKYPDSVLIFVTAPKVEDLKNRLVGRGTEDLATINKRLKRSYEETKVIENYDYILINDKADECAEQVHHIIVSEHMRTIRNLGFNKVLQKEFEELLKGDL